MSEYKSVMMDKLYGEEISARVYNRLEELDPLLNEIIQKIAYDYFWALPGLSIRDKSLVTIVTLIALGKEEQIKIHMNGFLYAGGSKDELSEILKYLSVIASPLNSLNGWDTFMDVLRVRGERIDDLAFNEQYNMLSDRDKQFINVSCQIASGDQEKTKISMRIFLESTDCDQDQLKHILIHQIVYGGFPTSMNGFAALKEVLNQST